jgi:hypothetical protein
MGMWEHIKLGELPPHNTLGFFCWGRSLKIHIEIKRECSYREQLNTYNTDMGEYISLVSPNAIPMLKTVHT